MNRSVIGRFQHFFSTSKLARALRAIVTLASTSKGRMFIDLSIVTVIGIVVFRNFIWTNGWPGGGDALGWVSREYLFGHGFRWLSLWRPYSFGFVEGINSMDFFLMLIDFIFKGGALTVKVFSFSMFIIGGFSMYAFAYHYGHSSLAAFSASLVYMLNPWSFSQYTEVHIDIIFGYALAPLLFLLFDRALKNGRPKDVVVFAIVFSMCLTGFYPASVVIYTFFLVLFSIFYIFAPEASSDLRKRLKRAVKILLLAAVLAFFLSAFYVLPFISNVRARFYTTAFGYDIEEAYINSYQSLGDAFFMKAIESWGYRSIVDVRTGLGLELFPLSVMMFIVLVLAYCTPYFRRDRYTFFFLASAIVSMFVAKGPYSPYGEIFIWAWFNVPYFKAFRVASRFSMMTALSEAFLISVLVCLVIDYFSKTSWMKHGRSLEVTLESDDGKEQILYSSKDVQGKRLNLHAKSDDGREQILYAADGFKRTGRLSSGLKRFLAVFTLILILSTSFFSCWFFIWQGLQVYDPPPDFVSPYYWVAQQPGDFKIISASKSAGQWESTNTESDIAFVGMLTPLGYGHDIGFESSFIHDKPVLQDGGWELKPKMLVNFLRFKLVRGIMTDQLLRFLGTFNYKYVVLPSYSTEDVREFFLRQEGAEVVYNESGALIIENAFHNPEIFVARQHMIVAGGPRSLFSLLKIGSFDPTKSIPMFADELVDSDFLESSTFDRSDTLVFDDSELMDLTMLSKNMNVILASQYGVASRNYSQYWAPAGSWNEIGSLVLGENTLTTSGKTTINIPFETNGSGEHQVLLRVGYLPGRGSLTVRVDGDNVGTIRPNADSWIALKWTSVGTINLEKGRHTITLTNDGTGWNDVDAIAVVESNMLKQQEEETSRRLNAYTGRILLLASAAHAFAQRLPEGWHLIGVPYQGEMLEGFNSSNLNANVTIPKEGWYRMSARVAFGPEFGTVNFKLGDLTTTVSCNDASQGFRWVDLGTSYLTNSNLTVSVEAIDRVLFDQLAFYSISGADDTTHLDQLFKAEQSLPSIVWSKTDETKYVAHVNTNESFFLVFSESYNPLWKAFVNGKEIPSTAAYSLVNSFCINETGEFDVVISFTGQFYADVGLWISAATLSVALAYLVAYPKMFHKFERFRWKRSK